MEDRRHDGGWGKNEVPRSFSGWLSDIITAGPSLLVFSLVPFPSHFLFRGLISFSLSLSPFPVPSSYFVSRHCSFQSPWDCGANTAGYRINFLSRGCWDFTLLERRRWSGSRSQKPPRLLRSRGVGHFGLVSRSKWGWNQAAKKIKTRNRRFLKGSRLGCSRISISIASILVTRPRTFSLPQNTSFLLAFRLSFPDRIVENDAIALRLTSEHFFSAFRHLLHFP